MVLRAAANTNIRTTTIARWLIGSLSLLGVII